MSCANIDSRSALCAFPGHVADLDVSTADEAELREALAQVRTAQRCLEGLTVRIGVRANALASQGLAAPALETLRSQGMVGAAHARQEARRVEVAEAAPHVIEGLDSGHLCGEHIDAIARQTARLTDEQRDKFDYRTVVAQGARLAPEPFKRFLKHTIDTIQSDHGLGDTMTARRASRFRHWFDDKTGLGRFSGSLDPERYEQFTTAIEQRCAELAASGGVEKNANLAAQCVVDLVTATGERGARARLPSILVVVDQQTVTSGPHPRSVRQTENGHDVAYESVSRLACDATIRRVTLDQRGVPINVGRRYRTATDAQWAALKTIYCRCAWDGCTAPISWCQAHHIQEWERGGPTDLGNLVPLCSRHHHRVHEGQWTIKLKPDRSLAIHKPDSTSHATTPPPTRSPVPSFAEPERSRIGLDQMHRSHPTTHQQHPDLTETQAGPCCSGSPTSRDLGWHPHRRLLPSKQANHSDMSQVR